ncbi:MAG TPA: hypothetical protein VEI97_00700, partial [bacterium]|nr:hypothetical protein [bacterium]
MNPQQSTTRKTDKPAAAVGSTANGRPEPAPGSLPLPPDQLQELHRYLKLCREFDQKMVDMFKAGQLLGTYFSAVGQEACDIVPGFFCREQD